MLNPEAVSYWVKQGQAPAHWRIVRGSASLAVRASAKYFIFQFICFGLGIVIGWLINILTHIPSDLVPALLMMISFLPIWIAGFFIRASMAKGSVMVFLPEGCLQFTNMNSSIPYTNKVVWFASVADIQLRINFWIGSHLLIRTYDGSTLKWRPDPCFGPQGKTLQEILAAYTRYQMLNPPRAEHGGYTHYDYPQSVYGMRMG